MTMLHRYLMNVSSRLRLPLTRCDLATLDTSTIHFRSIPSCSDAVFIQSRIRVQPRRLVDDLLIDYSNAIPFAPLYDAAIQTRGESRDRDTD